MLSEQLKTPKKSYLNDREREIPCAYLRNFLLYLLSFSLTLFILLEKLPCAEKKPLWSKRLYRLVSLGLEKPRVCFVKPGFVLIGCYWSILIQSGTITELWCQQFCRPIFKFPPNEPFLCGISWIMLSDEQKNNELCYPSAALKTSFRFQLEFLARFLLSPLLLSTFKGPSCIFVFFFYSFFSI